CPTHSSWPSSSASPSSRGRCSSSATGSWGYSDERNGTGRPRAGGRTARVPDRRALEAGVVRMTGNAWLQLLVYLAVLLAAVKPRGWYMARVYPGRPCALDRGLGGLERLLYGLSGVDAGREMTWRTYAGAVLVFNGIGLVSVYLLL